MFVFATLGCASSWQVDLDDMTVDDGAFSTMLISVSLWCGAGHTTDVDADLMHLLDRSMFFSWRRPGSDAGCFLGEPFAQAHGPKFGAVTLCIATGVSRWLSQKTFNFDSVLVVLKIAVLNRTVFFEVGGQPTLHQKLGT